MSDLLSQLQGTLLGARLERTLVCVPQPKWFSGQVHRQVLHGEPPKYSTTLTHFAPVGDGRWVYISWDTKAKAWRLANAPHHTLAAVNTSTAFFASWHQELVPVPSWVLPWELNT